MHGVRGSGPFATRDRSLRELESHRKHLWGVCYRMTGSAAEAEDLVQETFRRALETPPADLERDLRPWLVRVAINLGRDALRARKRRGYDGTWLPSPVETSVELAMQPKLPDARYGELESVTFAFLVALEALTPTQRAVLLLRDVFDYSVRETADALGVTETNVKTTLHRARHAMEKYDAHAQPPTPERIAQASEVLRAFCMHLFTRNAPALEALLSADVLARNDAGGEFHAARKVIAGRARVIRFHLNTLPYALGSLRMTLVNGSPAIVADVPTPNPRIARRVVVRIETDANGKVTRIDSIGATAKLTAIDFGASPWSTVALFLEGARSAALHPPPKSWLPAAARALARAAKPRLGGRRHSAKRR